MNLTKVTMRKLTMLTALILTVTTVFGQMKNVNKAKTALENEEIAEALALIVPATADAKSGAKTRTWLLQGDIYKAILLSSDDAVKALDGEALNKAIASYKKVMEIGKEGSPDYASAQMNLDHTIDFTQTGLAKSVLNGGAAAFQSGDYETAYADFINFTKISPKDTTGFMFGGIAASQLEKYDDALKNFKQVLALGYFEKSIVNSIIDIELNKLKKYDDALKTIELGKEKFPDDNNFNKLEVDAFIKMEKLDEAIDHLKSTIETEPDNAGLFINLGMLYAYNNDYEHAIPHYKKALELKPDDMTAIENLADAYISQGNVYNKQASDMDIKTFTKEGDKVMAQAKEWYEKAIPLLETSNEMKPDDKTLLQALNGLYIRLKQNDKAEAIYNQRVKLGYIDEEN